MKVILLLAIFLQLGSCFFLGLLSSKLNLVHNIFGGIFSAKRKSAPAPSPVPTATPVIPVPVQIPVPIQTPVVNPAPIPTVSNVNNINIGLPSNPFQATPSFSSSISPSLSISPRSQFSLLAGPVNSLPSANIFTSPQFTRNNLLNRVPTNDQISYLISGGDILTIKAVVNSLVSGRYGVAAIDPLNRILSGIRSFVNLYELSRRQGSQQVKSYQRKIDFYTAELNDLQRGIPLKNTASYRVNLAGLVSQGDQLENEFALTNQEITQIENQIMRLRGNNFPTDFSTFRVSNFDLQKINDLNSQIQIRRAKLEQIERLLQENQFRIANIRELNKYSALYGNVAEAQRQQDLNILIRDLQNTFLEILSDSNNLMGLYKTYVDEYPNIFNTVNSYYYNTLRVSNNIREDDVIDYVNQVYRPTTRISKISPNLRSSSASYQLRPFDFLSNDWIDNYGFPQFTKNIYNNDYENYRRNFQCDPLSNIFTIVGGVVQNIIGNFIRVLDNKNQGRYLKLGGCTRIQSLTNNKIPKIGDFIYSKGKLGKSEKYGEAFDAYQVMFY